MHLQPSQPMNSFSREDISEYVAELQLHMSLHARNLLPNLSDVSDSRQQLLQETQAYAEKLVSRQAHFGETLGLKSRSF